MLSSEECNVAEAERCGVVISAGAAVFAWAHEKEKGNPSVICQALLHGASVLVDGEDTFQDRERDWFESLWGWVLSGV